MGRPTAGRGETGEARPLLPTRLMAAFFPGNEGSSTVVMGVGKGSNPQELAEKKLQPWKMQGEKPTSFLKVIWHRYSQESWAKTLILKASFSPKEYTGTREALGRRGNREEQWSGQQLLEPQRIANPSPHLMIPLPKAFKVNDNGYRERYGRGDSHFLRNDCMLNLPVYISSSGYCNYTTARQGLTLFHR